MRRWIVIGLVAAAAAGLLYAASALDLGGMLVSIHAPPVGGH